VQSRERCGFRQSAQRVLFKIEGVDSCECRHPEGKGPDAGKKNSYVSGASGMGANFRRGCVACKKAPGGGNTVAFPMASTGARRQTTIIP
jgi:hypothetical protein